MCKIMEEYAKEYAKELIENKIRDALSKKKDPESIADMFDVSLESVMKIKESME